MDLIQEFEKKQTKREIPSIKPGDTIKVHQKIKEGDKERIQIFEGVVIKIHRKYGINGNVTVRKVASGVGVEKTFPFHLSSIVKMEVVKRGKIRRAKLFYLRRLQEKAAKLKDKKLTDEDRAKLIFDTEADAEKEKKAKKEQNGSKAEKKDKKVEVKKELKEEKPEKKEAKESTKTDKKDSSKPQDK